MTSTFLFLIDSTLFSGATHLIMEAIALASHRNLAPDHPVFKLLAHHFLYIMAINQYVHNLSPRCSKYPVLFNYSVIKRMCNETFSQIRIQPSC